MKRVISALAVLLMLSVGTAFAGSHMAPPEKPYQKVSELVALPEFIPGMGTLYVQPATLPVGPFLAYDRDGKLVSTIYMVPVADLESHKAYTGLGVGDMKVEKVDLVYNAGHPGVEAPHYHVVIWHVAPGKAKLK